MDFTAVRPNVYCAPGDPTTATISLIVGQEGCLIVDTGGSLAQGQAIREAVARATDRPLSTVVVTHGHWDHSFGLGAYDDLDTVGHQNLSEDMTCAENRAYADTHGIDLADMPLPHQGLDLIGVRDLGATTVEIASFGPAHTRSDLIVAVPDRRVLIVGDLVDTDAPQFDETSSLKGWVLTLDSLYAMLREDTLIIAGHTGPIGPGTVAHFRTGLAAIWDQAEWAYRRDVPVDQVYDYDELQWPWDRGTVEQGIVIAYRELAAKPTPDQSAGRIGPQFTGAGLPIQAA
ncbi:MAG: MBL fold metallo-hydrolase [Propionibacteriaceae bacterium]|jgi:glyoxylase-like metal-dependent hydrolase (beta-lactamase superfamily II)|nr:MBL fold metallo-hydrolase [Propionibacteriaceae bacterium]